MIAKQHDVVKETEELSDDSFESLTKVAAIWPKFQDQLRQTYGDSVYKNWLKPMHCKRFEEGELLITVPSRFVREWIHGHYMETINQLLKQLLPEISQIEIRVAPQEEKRQDPTRSHEPVTKAPHISSSVETTEPKNSLNYAGAALDQRFTFDNFVVGKPNELAYAASKRVAESDSVVHGCNPLFLYGGVGLGKTHLMHAIAWHIRKTNPERRVLYLSAEKFMYQFIRALRFNEAIAFKEQFRSVDVLMIDDVQFISGKDSTQEEFFPYIQCACGPA